MDFQTGDRVRIDLGSSTDSSDGHGAHGVVESLQTEGVLVRLDRGEDVTVPVESLRPVASFEPTLVHRELDTATNVWGDVPEDLREIETGRLWSMRREVIDAVERCYEDDDMDALGIIGPLDVKLCRVLAERLE